jgi:hypothetical protein
MSSQSDHFREQAARAERLARSISDDEVSKRLVEAATEFRRQVGVPRLLELPNSAHQNDVQINCIHSGAVCDPVGETLSVTLGPQSNELPLRVAGLMKQLAMDETDGIERMKDFSNASFPPDIIKSYEAGSEWCTLYTSPPGHFNECSIGRGNNSADRRTANETQRF